MGKLIVFVCLLAVVVNCSDDSTLEPLSVEDYTSEICNGEEKSLPADATWGQYVDQAQSAVDRFEEIVPPSGVEEYHQAIVGLLRAHMEAASRLESAARMDPPALVGEEDVAAAWQAVYSASAGMESQIWQTLRAADCPL